MRSTMDLRSCFLNRVRESGGRWVDGVGCGHFGGGWRLLPGDVPAQKGQSGRMARHGFYREVNATFDDEIYY